MFSYNKGDVSSSGWIVLGLDHPGDLGIVILRNKEKETRTKDHGKRNLEQGTKNKEQGMRNKQQAISYKEKGKRNKKQKI
jgi:hypothetical protein